MNKNTLRSALLMLVCFCSMTTFSQVIDLAGKWRFKLDPKNVGLEEKWFSDKLSQKIQLPGSLQEQGYGYDVDENTKWTGGIVDKSWYTSPAYAEYRKKGNVKVPFWLNPDKHYIGVAWYQRSFDIPKSWDKSTIVFSMERLHWGSTVFIDDNKIGECNALQVPHRYELNGLKPGKHTLTVRVDNGELFHVGYNAHSVSDHTQSNWNGIVGAITLEKKASAYFDDTQIYADIHKKEIEVKLTFCGQDQKSKLILQAVDQQGNPVSKKKEEIIAVGEGKTLAFKLPLDKSVRCWSEFDPAVYTLKSKLITSAGNTDERSTDFGLREITINHTRFAVNNRPLFLRGTLECCVFPYTGYPATDDAYWEKIYSACHDYGLNHVRFHSWCPPAAAFRVADRIGIYLQVECGGWTSIGEGNPQDKWFYEEADRIIKEYGNHPSFCFMAYGNEPSGRIEEYLTKFVNYLRQKDNRKLYTSAGGWPYIPNADYWNTADPRIQGWDENLRSVINAKEPSTDYDFWGKIRKDMPTVSHEVGQWCVYPNFNEIKKYKGVLKAKNFEIFQETLNKHHLGDLADEFLFASGRLQTLCYKADIEAALRTPKFAGFQLLSLGDFPGQGSALVGTLDAFWENKGYVDGKEYRTFCNRTVPLARLSKMTFLNNEYLKVPLEFAHFDAEPMKSAHIYWELKNKEGKLLHRGSWVQDLPIDNTIWIGNMEYDLKDVKGPETLILSAGIENTDIKNSWNIWVYPAKQEPVNALPYITTKLDQKAIEKLNNGENVLLCTTRGSVRPEKGGDIKVGFSTIFWNTAWTRKQAPHTLGIYCNPAHPALASFPTEKFSDYQWWEIVSNCEALVIDDFPSDYRPIVHLIDDWFTARKLGLLFEAKVGNGKLMVCGADLSKIDRRKIALNQFKQSILEYMASEQFKPANTLSIEMIQNLYK